LVAWCVGVCVGFDVKLLRCGGGCDQCVKAVDAEVIVVMAVMVEKERFGR
jgi:hypothetical protein